MALSTQMKSSPGLHPNKKRKTSSRGDTDSEDGCRTPEVYDERWYSGPINLRPGYDGMRIRDQSAEMLHFCHHAHHTQLTDVLKVVDGDYWRAYANEIKLCRKMDGLEKELEEWLRMWMRKTEAEEAGEVHKMTKGERNFIKKQQDALCWDCVECGKKMTFKEHEVDHTVIQNIATCDDCTESILRACEESGYPMGPRKLPVTAREETSAEPPVTTKGSDTRTIKGKLVLNETC